VSALSRVLRDVEGGRLMFWCPGCDGAHMIEHGNGRWTWNGDVERPTFSPSILVRWEHGPERTPRVCHSFVTDGRIRFLADCTHVLAGQTVPLPDFDHEGWE
jgi:hypothetical protein